MRKVIAIDFDGCLCEYAWPEIGAPHMEVINAALQEREKGVALILWTCRAGKRLDEAVNWCERYGLKFDAVNENLPGIITDFKVDTRKVFADEYWDDRAVHMPIPPNEPLTLEELRKMDGEPVWIDNGHGRNKCYIVNNGYEIHGEVEPCGIDLWGAGTSLSLLVRCGVYRQPPNREESA